MKLWLTSQTKSCSTSETRYGFKTPSKWKENVTRAPSTTLETQVLEDTDAAFLSKADEWKDIKEKTTNVNVATRQIRS